MTRSDHGEPARFRVRALLLYRRSCMLLYPRQVVRRRPSDHRRPSSSRGWGEEVGPPWDLLAGPAMGEGGRAGRVDGVERMTPGIGITG